MQPDSAERYPCVIPAAGLSRRMDRWKPVLAFRGHTIVEQVVSVASSFCAPIIVVTGHRGGELAERLLGEEIETTGEEREIGYDRSLLRIVPNHEYRRGMFSSIRAGLGSLERRSASFIALADMPWVLPLDYRTLAARLAADPDCEAVRYLYGSTPGHPVLLGATVIDEVLAFSSEGSMPEILANRRVCSIPADDSRVIRDIDHPAEYRPE